MANENLWNIHELIFQDLDHDTLENCRKVCKSLNESESLKIILRNKLEKFIMAEQTKVLKGPQDLADDLLKRRTKGTLEEYLNLEDPESAFTDVCSHFHPNHMSRVAEEMIFGVIEDKPSKMKKTGELLDSLVIKHALLPTQLQNAFNQLLQVRFHIS